MTTMTQNPKARKVSKSLRSLRIGQAVNGVRAMVLTQDGERCGYYLRELRVDFGRGFRLEKFDTDAGSDENERSYDVHLDAQLGNSCTCKGFLFHRHGKPCKHIAACETLVKLGTFKAPVNAPHGPAETEEPEYAVREASAA